MKTTRRSTGRNTGNPNSMSGRAWLPGYTYDLRSELTKTFLQIAPEAKNQNKTKQKKYWEKIIKHTHSQDKSMLVLSILYFLCERWAVWDINVTIGLLPSQAHVIWRDSVSVQALKQSLREFYSRTSRAYLFLAPYWRALKKGETAVYGYYPAFGVVWMSCKFNFHVVRSALQNSVCLIHVW